MKGNKNVSQLAQKIYRYCAYQERSYKETKKRLEKYGLPPDEIAQTLADLQREGYLDFHRFARSYARGKFTIKKWGKLKIIRNMRAHDLEEQVIREGLKEISDEMYYLELKKILIAKYASIVELNEKKKKHKVIRHAVMKGYEPHFVLQIVDELLTETSS